MVVAMTDLLRHQVNFTKHFIDGHRRIAEAVATDLSSSRCVLQRSMHIPFSTNIAWHGVAAAATAWLEKCQSCAGDRAAFQDRKFMRAWSKKAGS
jgi:hypothetical protein